MGVELGPVNETYGLNFTPILTYSMYWISERRQKVTLREDLP